MQHFDSGNKVVLASDCSQNVVIWLEIKSPANVMTIFGEAHPLFQGWKPKLALLTKKVEYTEQ